MEDEYLTEPGIETKDYLYPRCMESRRVARLMCLILAERLSEKGVGTIQDWLDFARIRAKDALQRKHD